MNYEQKYKEALEWMRSIYPTMQGVDKEDAEHYFPELKESEDEKIRKAIIEHYRGMHSAMFPLRGLSREEYIAWLEKQGEQKPVEQDTETHDLWVYIREWNDKFGRLPVDEDELEACINYVMKRQKDAWSEKHIADVFEKVGLAKIVREQGNDQLTNAVQSAMIELSKTAGGFVWKKI